jgi:hypothetical protein
VCFHTAEAGRKLTLDRRKSGDHGIALALGIYQNGSLLIKSYVSRCGCTIDNCSHHNNLAIKRPAWTVSESVGKVGGIEPHLTAKDKKDTFTLGTLLESAVD